MNIFKEMAFSVYNFKSYKEFLNNRKSKVFGFGLMVMLIYFTVTMVAPFVKFMAETDGIANEMDDVIPDFELEDGTLWVQEVIEFEENGTYVYIDTDPEYYFYDADEMKEYLYEYSEVILMDSEKVIIKSDGQVKGAYFSELDVEFSKQDLLDLVPVIHLCIGIFFVLAYIWMTGLYFFGVLFVALLGMIAASCMKKDLTFGQLYLLGIYSRTLPLIIKAVLSFLPVGIPFFFIINFGISLAIIVCAIGGMNEKQLQQPLEFTSGSNGYGGNGYGSNNFGSNFSAGNYNAGNYSSNNYNGNFSSNYSTNNSTNNSTMNQGGDKSRNKNDFSWMQ